ncbi:uncharacterized protein [Lepeophtheirus salmonis]|uniref:XK-related protein n=1 Tax=Lepeophtheirus salmonis TaxID=72036 RepID=A0A0K2TQ10_LEPSM|nr:uncharacterized protein LOC121118658 [Lepeophtheirus salmonis]
MGSGKSCVTFFVVALFVLDTTTDICTGVELILNDHHGWGGLVLFCVFLPTLLSVIGEVLRGCAYSGCCGEACTDWIPLIFYHLYSVIMMAGSQWQPRWKKEGDYLRWIQGLTQSGPQLLLQTVIVLRGVLIHSFAEVMHKLLQGDDDFSYLREKDPRWFWGLIQVASLFFSFLSLLQTVVHFNEWEKRRHTLQRLLIVIPYFFITILYRLLCFAILFALSGKVGFLPLFGLMITQIVTLSSLGLDFGRSVLYGMGSIFVPIGYGRARDPLNQPLGLSLLPGQENFSICDNTIRGGDRSPEQVEMLRERSRQYLAMHLILGGAILGMSIGIIAMLINFTELFVPLESYIIFNEAYMNSSIFPGLGLLYTSAIILTTIYTCGIGRCFEEEYIYPV